MMVPKMILLFQGCICRFHVNLPGFSQPSLGVLVPHYFCLLKSRPWHLVKHEPILRLICFCKRISTNNFQHFWCQSFGWKKKRTNLFLTIVILIVCSSSIVACVDAPKRTSAKMQRGAFWGEKAPRDWEDILIQKGLNESKHHPKWWLYVPAIQPPKIPLYIFWSEITVYITTSHKRQRFALKAASLVGEITLGRRIQRLMISKLGSDFNLLAEEMRSCYCKQHATNTNPATFQEWGYTMTPVKIENPKIRCFTPQKLIKKGYILFVMGLPPKV